MLGQQRQGVVDRLTRDRADLVTNDVGDVVRGAVRVGGHRAEHGEPLRGDLQSGVAQHCLGFDAHVVTVCDKLLDSVKSTMWTNHRSSSRRDVRAEAARPEPQAGRRPARAEGRPRTVRRIVSPSCATRWSSSRRIGCSSPRTATAIRTRPSSWTGDLRKSHRPGTRVRCTWIEIDQVARRTRVLLSRPFWMWGAEMGANEHGVTIGNEAVFTDQPYAEAGLTGMDLLRLALERAETAEAAVEVITELLERHGQGGGCGHENPDFTYHNSFIVADPREAFVLETADAWALEAVDHGARSISNGLTIPGFADHADRLHTHFSRCRTRQAITESGAQTATSRRRSDGPAPQPRRSGAEPAVHVADRWHGCAVYAPWWSGGRVAVDGVMGRRAAGPWRPPALGHGHVCPLHRPLQTGAGDRAARPRPGSDGPVRRAHPVVASRAAPPPRDA